MFGPGRVEQEHRRAQFQRPHDGVPGATDAVVAAVVPDADQQVGLFDHHPCGQRGLGGGGGMEMACTGGIVRRCQHGLEQGGDRHVAVGQFEQAGPFAAADDGLRPRLHPRIDGVGTGQQGQAVGVGVGLRIDGHVEPPAKRQWRHDLPAPPLGGDGGQLVHARGQQAVQAGGLDLQARAGGPGGGQACFDPVDDAGQCRRHRGLIHPRRATTAAVAGDADREPHALAGRHLAHARGCRPARGTGVDPAMAGAGRGRIWRTR